MRYNEQQKADALKLADEIGAKKASEQLSIAYPTILDWRKKSVEITEIADEAPSIPLTIEDSDGITLAVQVQLLQQENAQLKAQLARQTEAIHALSPLIE